MDNKKISVESLEKIMNSTHNNTKTVEWNGVEITIKNTLGFREVLTFVDSVTKSCFTPEENSYLPEVKEFAIKCCVLTMYANFDMNLEIEHKYDLVYCTDAVSVVVEHINKAQLNEIIDAINDKIDNIAQANIEAVNKQMNEVYSAINNLQSQFAGIFNGVGADELVKLIGTISDGKIDESKLVQSYIDQKNSGHTK